MGVFALFSAVDYKAWYALAEFVDNSVQSFLDSRHQLPVSKGASPSLRVCIDTQAGPGQDEIHIRDNAGGISGDRLASALQVATPPPDTTGLSVYGIGMKSAAAWFAQKFRLSTSVFGEPVRREVVFNFPRIIEDGIERLTIREFPTEKEAHFTTLELSGLNHPIQTSTHEKVRTHLASIYRLYLRQETVRIEYNGQPVEFMDIPVLKAARYDDDLGAGVEWSKDIDITLTSGERLHGFAALRSTASTKSPGFALFRQGRVITGIEDDPWRPYDIFGPSNKFPAQRLFGELHLENVKVTYSKNGFVWRTAEEELIQALLQQVDSEPLPLLKQAAGYRARKAAEAERAAGRQALQRTASDLERGGSEALETELNRDPVAEPDTELPDAADIDSQSVQLSVRGDTWTVTVELTNEPDSSDWLEIADSNLSDRTLQIRLSMSHPFSRRYTTSDPDELEPIIRLAASIALATIVGRMRRDVGSVLSTLNTFLAGPFSGANR